jgi:hypothetical protein
VKLHPRGTALLIMLHESPEIYVLIAFGLGLTLGGVVAIASFYGAYYAVMSMFLTDREEE